MTTWNATQYDKFKQERTLPAKDLVQSIECKNPSKILDIGCGSGFSTNVLKQKFPNANIIGIDNSEEMLVSARKNYPEISFLKLDIESELKKLSKQFDVVFSNACLQWVGAHKILFPEISKLVCKGGVLAVQMPNQNKQLMHKIIRQVATSQKWASKIQNLRNSNLLSEEEYFDILSKHFESFRIWETVYFHALPNHNALVEWFKGTGLRPYLEQMNAQDRELFEKDILEETKKAFPLQENGRVLLKFPRLFFVAKK